MRTSPSRTPGPRTPDRRRRTAPTDRPPRAAVILGAVSEKTSSSRAFGAPRPSPCVARAPPARRTVCWRARAHTAHAGFPAHRKNASLSARFVWSPRRAAVYDPPARTAVEPMPFVFSSIKRSTSRPQRPSAESVDASGYAERIVAVDRRARFRDQHLGFEVSLEQVQRVVAVRGGTAGSTGGRRQPVAARACACDSTGPSRRARRRACRQRTCFPKGAPRTGASRRPGRAGEHLAHWDTPRARRHRRSAGARSGASSGAAFPGGGASRGAWQVRLEQTRSCRSRALRFARPPVARDLPRRDLPRLLDQVGDTQGERRIPGRSPWSSRSQPSALRQMGGFSRIGRYRSRATTGRDRREMFEWSSRGVGTKNRRSVDLGRIRTTPRGACVVDVGFGGFDVPSRGAPIEPRVAARAHGRGRARLRSARGRARRGIAIVAKRSARSVSRATRETR